jgi:outer membrane protein assembly factor BamA
MRPPDVCAAGALIVYTCDRGGAPTVVVGFSPRSTPVRDSRGWHVCKERSVLNGLGFQIAPPISGRAGRTPATSRIRRLMRHPFTRVRHRALIVAMFGLLPAFATRARGQDVECDPGDREVRGLDFVGNQAFNDAELAQRVATTPSSLSRRLFRVVGTRRCFDPDVGLANDVEQLRQFYKQQGYYDTAVDTLVRGDSDAVAITFLISEGQPVRVDSLAITGLDSVVGAADVLRRLKLAPGNRFGSVLLSTDIDSITIRLRNSGYAYATVLPDVRVQPAQHRAEVTLNVLSGPRVHFGAIQIDITPAPGKPKPQIDSAVVARLLGIKPGDLYSVRTMATARRTLIQTAVYVHVDVAAALDTAVAPTDSIVRLIVQLREDLTRQVDGEIGWATLDCFRALGQYTDKSFLSDARRLELTSRLSKLGHGRPTHTPAADWACHTLKPDSLASSTVNYSLNATLHPVAIAGRPATALSLYTERRGEYLEYLRETFIGGAASVTKELDRFSSGRGSYSLEYGKTKAEPALLCAIFSRCDEESRDQVGAALPLAIASASYQQRKTDDAFDPRRGTILRGELRGSTRYIGSDPSLSFLKGTLDAAWYHALAPRTILALRFRAGAIGGGASSKEGGTKLPPPQERLFAGGATSVRGYQPNQLGELVYLLDVKAVDSTLVNDTTLVYTIRPAASPYRVIPVGGNSLVVANVDLRLRDPFFPNLLQYALFTDIGGVWTRQPGKSNLALKQLKYTPGVGVRVFSPVGAIQVNLGYKPYQPTSGAALYAPSSGGGFAPLYCVAPSGQPAIPIHPRVVDGATRWVQDDAKCPEAYAPARSNTFLKKLTWTISIGPDF